MVVRDAAGTVTVRSGATLAGAGIVHTFSGAQTGTFYADSSLYAMGGKATVRFGTQAFAATGPVAIAGSANASSTAQGDGSYLVEKIGGGSGWNAQATSSAGLAGEFSLKIVRGTGNTDNVAVGVSRNPGTDSGYTSIDHAVIIDPTGSAYVYAAGTYAGTAFSAANPVWIVRDAAGVVTVRSGTTLAGATTMHTFAGTQTGTFFADSSFYPAGGKATLTFEGTGAPASTGTTTRFLYDGDELVAEYGPTGTLLRRYVHGAGIDDPMVWYEGPGLTDPRYLHTNHQGSVTGIAGPTGALINIDRYDEYGMPASTNIGRFQYTGQIWLPEIGRYYYKARMYDPRDGRLMQVDPSGITMRSISMRTGGPSVHRTGVPSGGSFMWRFVSGAVLIGTCVLMTSCFYATTQKTQCDINYLGAIAANPVGSKGRVFCGDIFARANGRLVQVTESAEETLSGDLAWIVTKKSGHLLKGLTYKPGKYYIEAVIDPIIKCFEESESEEKCVPHNRPIIMHLLSAQGR